MNQISKRVSFLRGLASGMEQSNEERSAGVVGQMADVMEEIADELEQIADDLWEVKQRQDEQEAYLEAMDLDLQDVEAYLFGDAEEEADGEEEEFIYTPYAREEAGEESLIELECPNCRQDVVIDEAVLDDDQVAEVLCPDCHEVLLIKSDGEDGVESYVLEREREEFAH